MRQRINQYGWLALVLVWFAILLTWLLSLSQVSLKTGLQIRGAKHWVAGTIGMIRINGLDVKLRHPAPIQAPEIRWTRTTTKTPWIGLEKAPKGTWQGACEAPSESGIWTLEARAFVRGEHVYASSQIDIMPTAPPVANKTIVTPPPTQVKGTDEESSCAFAAVDGALLRSVENLMLLTCDPDLDAVTVYAEMPNDDRLLLKLDHTDIEGLYTFNHTPDSGEVELIANVGNLEMVWRRESVLAYFSIHGIEATDQGLKVTVESRDNDRNFFVDVWQAERWLASQILPGGARLNTTFVPIPHQIRGPIWIQAYSNPFVPHTLRGGRYADPTQSYNKLMDEWFRDVTHQKWQALSDSKLSERFRLGRLPSPKATPSVLADSTVFQKPELVETRRRWLLIVVSVLGLSTALLVIILFRRIMQHRAAINSQFLELDDEDDLTMTDGHIQTSFTDGLILLSIIGLFVSGIAWLFFTAKWS